MEILNKIIIGIMEEIIRRNIISKEFLPIWDVKNKFKRETIDLIQRELSFVNVNEKSGSITGINIKVKTFKEISTYLWEKYMWNSEIYLQIDKNNKKVAKCSVYTDNFISLPRTINANEEVKVALPFKKDNKIEELGVVVIELSYMWKGRKHKKFYSLSYNNESKSFNEIKDIKYKRRL